MNKQMRALAQEAEAILLGVGFIDVHAQHFGPFWRVYGRLANGDEHVGVTDKQADPQDPREMARTLAAKLAQSAEPAEGVEHEAHEETGAADANGSVHAEGVSASAEALEGPEEPDLRPDDTPDPIDADFSEPLSLGAEILEADEPEPAGGAFIFGDNIHQLRTAAIGGVVQIALERLPDNLDYARLAELRNFTMGVSEGRWPDDSAKRIELDALEAIERYRREVETERDTKVGFLVAATREEIEDFNPNEGWP